MLIRHREQEPTVSPEAYVAATAIVIGDVRIASGARILHGAVVTAEDGSVVIGADCVVMEHALVRGRGEHPVRIGSSVMIGPHTHINGSTVEPGAFIATGATLLPGSVVRAGAEIRVNAVVHVNTTIEAGVAVPIGWVAVGTPATLLPPDRHDEIWAIQQTLDFPGTVYGVSRDTPMQELMRQQSEYYGAHVHDTELGSESHARAPIIE